MEGYINFLLINERCYQDAMFLEQQLRGDMASVLYAMPNLQTPGSSHLIQMMRERICSFANPITSVIYSELMTDIPEQGDGE